MALNLLQVKNQTTYNLLCTAYNYLEQILS